MAQHSADFRMVNYCNSATYMASMNFELAYIWDGHRFNEGLLFQFFLKFVEQNAARGLTKAARSLKSKVCSSEVHPPVSKHGMENPWSKWLRWWENPCKHCRTLGISNGYVSLPEGTMGLSDKLGWGWLGRCTWASAWGRRTEQKRTAEIRHSIHWVINFPTFKKAILNGEPHFQTHLLRNIWKPWKHQSNSLRIHSRTDLCCFFLFMDFVAFMWIQYRCTANCKTLKFQSLLGINPRQYLSIGASCAPHCPIQKTFIDGFRNVNFRMFNGNFRILKWRYCTI